MHEEPRVRPGIMAQELAAGARQRPRPGLVARDCEATSRHAHPAFQAAREQSAAPVLIGYICEQCFDAPATHLVPAPWGGDTACLPPDTRV